jgi:hypothetical protein
VSEETQAALIGGIIGLIGAVIGAVVGGLITGYYSRKATKDLLDGERSKREEEHRKELKALLSALRAEVVSVWDNYMATSGEKLDTLPDGQPFTDKVPIIADYLPVYHGSISLLGLIDDENLRMRIISGYTVAKSFVDTLRLNNELLKERDAASESAWHQGNNNASQNVLKLKSQDLLAYAGKLKRAHERAKQTGKELAELLQAAIKQL